MATTVALVVFLLAAGVGMSEGAVYKVGDAVGWTILGSPNYTAWAVSKNFEVGDTIVFEYNKNFHNVLEVSKADYSACNAASPIAKYSSGNDSIVIKSKGHHYFICGFPGHCSAGQKVDIKISKLSSAAPSRSPIVSPPSISPAVSPTSTPPAASPPSTPPSIPPAASPFSTLPAASPPSISPPASPLSTPPTASTPSSGGSTGSISPPTVSPKANSGTRDFPRGFALVLALFSFTVISGGIVRK